MPKYEPKPCVDREGKPRFNAKTYLEETVRLADRTTRDVMFIAHAGKGSPKALKELADAYDHAANRLRYVADGLNVKGRAELEAKEPGNEDAQSDDTSTD